jgi:hypothetical protein
VRPGPECVLRLLKPAAYKRQAISSCHPSEGSNCAAVDRKLEPRGLARCNCANKEYGALSVPRTEIPLRDVAPLLL